MKKKAGTRDASNQKGKIAEEIVSLLHQQPGITVERNVWLLTPDGEKREIDVLLSGSLAGYPVRVSIECKNYQRAIEKQDIDAFIGKLNDLSFPTQHGIFVTTSRFTKGAIKRANSAGIRTLLLSGLNKDHLKAAVYDSLQSVIYLFPVIASLSIQNNVTIMTTQELLTFTDETGNNFLLIDLIWHNWCNGYYPREVGEHHIHVKVQKGFTQIQNGQRLEEPTIDLLLYVYAVVVEVPGIANQFELKNPLTSNAEKFKVELSFEATNGQFPVHMFRTEEDLTNFMKTKQERYKITIGRVPIPRIMTPKLVFWPPSQRIVDDMDTLFRDKGTDLDLEKIDMLSLQGNNLLKAAYDEIWQGHPAAQRKKADIEGEP